METTHKFESDPTLTERQKRRRRYYYANKDRAIAQNKKWKAGHRDAVKASHAKWREQNRERIREYGRAFMRKKRTADGGYAGREYYYRNRERAAAVRRAAHQKRRRLVIEAYGGCCACCGDAHEQFLTIDHIFNDGKAHRMPTLGGLNLYRCLIKLGFPKDRYQLLCWNCNVAKRYYGVCPHQAERV